MRFLNRVDELRLLQGRLDSAQAELLVVYGRRRIGKTELLSHLSCGTRSLFVEATASVLRDQLADLTRELALADDDPVLRLQPLTSWDAALAAITRYVGDQRTLVVLDEFQYLAARAPELETVLSRWWRTTGRQLPIVLVLAGSELSFFEDRVLGGQLYGRRTGQLKLQPFLARDAALFHPGYDPADRVRAYSVCGGVPYYLDRFGDDRPLAASLLSEVFEASGLLHDEAELMLRQSLPDPSNHIAVLRAIAHGQTRNNAIVQRTSLQPAHVTKLLDSLERLGLVERQRPVTASPRARKTSFVISDQFLRFHYRFVEPARSQLRTRAMAAAYLHGTVLPQLDHHASQAWEVVCRQHVRRLHPEVSAVGRWWGQVPSGDGRRTEEREIDVAGVDAQQRPLVLGMCKWTSAAVDVRELKLLDGLTPHVEGSTGNEHRYLFSRSGFGDELRERAVRDPRVHLVTPFDIYAG